MKFAWVVFIFLSVFASTQSWAESAAEQYSSVSCGVSGADLQKRIEFSLAANKESLARRLTLAGFKGETLSKVIDISVQCADSTKKSYEQNDRILIHAFFQIRNNLCRFQFSTDSHDSINSILNFEYMHCVSSPL